jgi:SHS2 domain-containing protein
MKNRRYAKKFKFLEHTADVQFQAFGKTIEEMFGNAGLAMFNSMSEKRIKKKIVKNVKASGRDYESLLYNFLEELLVLFDGEGFFLSKVRALEINRDTGRFELEAEVVGDEAKNYEIHIDVKAITYHSMFVKQREKDWACQVVLDV